MNRLPCTIVIMGVSGCGKSLVGRMLAERLNAAFEDADDFHPASNKEKMSAGIPLKDEDRWPWYRILRERIVAQRHSGNVYVLACSSLKQGYRDLLRGNDGRDDLMFVHLKGSRKLIGERMVLRQGHFMPPELLDSQFAALEEPSDALTLDVTQEPDAMVRKILEHFHLRVQVNPKV